jgi:hypothetical protein
MRKLNSLRKENRQKKFEYSLLEKYKSRTLIIFNSSHTSYVHVYYSNTDHLNTGFQ